MLLAYIQGTSVIRCKRSEIMKFSVLEIFFVFWLSALLWVGVEYLYHRITKRELRNKPFDAYEKEKNSGTYAA